MSDGQSGQCVSVWSQTTHSKSRRYELLCCYARIVWITYKICIENGAISAKEQFLPKVGVLFSDLALNTFSDSRTEVIYYAI